MEFSYVSLLLIISALSYTLYVARKRRVFGHQFPPGPPPLSLGRLPLHPWKLFTRWNKIYGPIISFHLGSQLVIVIGNAEIARDLFNKKGRIYSGRPRAVVANEILSPLRGIGMSDGPRYRKWKTFMQAGLGPSVVQNYQELQSLEASVLVKELLEQRNPLQFRAHIKRFSASIMFCLAYGRRIRTLQDEVVLKQTQSTKYFLRASAPGKFLVDSWPVLLYLPRFMQWFRWEPERHRAFDTEFYLALMNEVRGKMRDGTAHPSMASYGLERQEEFGLSDEAAAYTLSAPWAAGVDTTSSAIEIFLMAMLLFPAVMRRAQQELDDVVGHDRLPNFQDMGKLPYIEALIKEVTRWRCVAPLGIPHAAMENDIYNSMFIPRGSTVYGNIFAMTRDESLFTEPDQFRPERFLNTSDPLFVNFTIPFGFGRRGKNIPSTSGRRGAETSAKSHRWLCANPLMFIVVTRILWAFNIHPPLDDEGNPVLPDSDSAFTGGAVVMTPTEFKCLFEARSDSTAEMLIQEAEKAEGELGRWA